MGFLPSYVEDEDKLFFTDMCGGIYCLKLSDGSVQFQHTDHVQYDTFSTGHCATGPNRFVYVTRNSSLRKDLSNWNSMDSLGMVDAFKFNGEWKWSKAFEKEGSHVAPVVLPLEDDKYLCIVVLGQNPSKPPNETEGGGIPIGDTFIGTVKALDGETGADVWSWQTPPFKSYVSRGSKKRDIFYPDAFGSPCIDARGVVYTICCSGFMYGLKGSTGELLYEFDIRSSSQSAPIVIPGMLIAAGALSAVVWKDRALEDEWFEK